MQIEEFDRIQEGEVFIADNGKTYVKPVQDEDRHLDGLSVELGTGRLRQYWTININLEKKAGFYYIGGHGKDKTVSNDVKPGINEYKTGATLEQRLANFNNLKA